MAFIPVYILILGFTIVIDYFAGMYLEDINAKNQEFWMMANQKQFVGNSLKLYPMAHTKSILNNG